MKAYDKIIRQYHANILCLMTMNLLFVEIKECDSSPCAHGATCNDELNGYECKCVAGFQGSNCETGIKAQLCLEI